MRHTNNVRYDLQEKQKRIAELKSMSVIIGVQKAQGTNWKGQKVSGNDRYPDSDLTVLDIAIIHEFGCKIKVTPNMRKKAFIPVINKRLRKSTTEISIPERAFIRIGRNNTIQDVFKFMSDNIYRVLGTYEWTPKEFWEHVGQVAVEQLVGTLGQGLKPKSRLTADIVDNDATLVASGMLQTHITYRVVKK